MTESYDGIKKYYRAYGLEVSSDFILPGLQNGSGKDIDVTIKLGKMQDIFPEIDIENLYPNSRCIKENEACRTSSSFDYRIANGSEVYLSSKFYYLLDLEKSDILAEIFRHILFQRRFICLHGSALFINGKVVAFTGEKGSGKSTIAAIIAQKGHELLADDSCFFSFDNKSNPYLLTTPFTQNLSAESLKILSIPTKGLKKTLDKNKYITEIRSPKLEKAMPLDRIYYLVSGNEEGIYLQEVKGHEKMVVLMNNASYMSGIDEIWPKGEFFRKWSDVAAKVTMIKITRSINDSAIPEKIINNIVSGSE